MAIIKPGRTRKTAAACLIWVGLQFLFSGCSSKTETVVPGGANEYLTTISLKLVQLGTSPDSVVATIRRRDPNDLIKPDTSSNTLVLKAFSYYRGYLILQDTTTKPVTDISALVIKRGVNHRVFYQPLPISSDTALLIIPGTPQKTSPDSILNMRISLNDVDTNGRYIGINTIINTKSPSAGKLRVVLRHQPDGLKDGKYGNGKSDFDYTFRVIIK